jgi:peroxiredoxin 2/4
MGFPNIGDTLPAFTTTTTKGLVSFPSYIEGHWAIVFAHPANFFSAWNMYSTFISLKERWFLDRKTRLLAVCNEPLGNDRFTEKVRRYIEIYLKAPVVEDLDYRVANILGIASGRKLHPEHDRVAYVVDPQGVVRLILYNHLKPTVEVAVSQLENALDCLQRDIDPLQSVEFPIDPTALLALSEKRDGNGRYTLRPAYFGLNKVHPN